MSWTALLEVEAARAEGEAPEPPLEWLLATLRQAMEELLADEAAKPLQKANAIARLGSLYLKTYRAAELVKENKALARRVAELEEALARASSPDAAPPEAPDSPAPAGVPDAVPLHLGPPRAKGNTALGRQSSRSRSRGQPAKHRAGQHR